MRTWLRELVAVASVSLPTSTGPDLARSAADVASLLRDADFDAVDVVEAGARRP